MALPRTLGVVAACVAVVALTAPVASGQPTPVSGDGRATVSGGNVTTCAQAGLPGTTIQPAQVQHSVTENTYIDVSSGTGITAIVVKGGPAYNEYLVPALGALPWLDLHAPLTPSGKPAEISHWFACGTPPTTTTTTTTTTAPTTTTTTTQPTTTTTPATTTTTTTSGTTTTSPSRWSSTASPTTTTTTSSAVLVVARTTTKPPVAAPKPDGLASTGFGSPWLVGLAALLLAGGAGVLLFLRRRKA